MPFCNWLFYRLLLDTKTQQRHFDNDHFIVEAPYSVQTKRIHKIFEIKTSVYLTVLSDTMIIVRFDNKN